MPATAIQFSIDPAFVSMLNQQPASRSSLQSALQNTRTVFAQQEDALRSGNDIGVPVLPTVEQTDHILANLQTNTRQWDDRLLAGLTSLVADFGAFCQSIDQQADASTIQANWRTSVTTARTVSDELGTLSGQVTDTYLQLPDQVRQLNALTQAVTSQLNASRAQIEQTRQDIDAQQRQIDKVKHNEEIAGWFVGSTIANSLGDLFTGMADKQNILNRLYQQAGNQERVANGLNQYATALSSLTSNLQTFTQHYADISNQWTALGVDLDNFDEGLADRIHTDGPFFKSQVRAAADNLNTVLRLFAS
ncbi:hypothetical protein [Spirosoma arcticum]